MLNFLGVIWASSPVTTNVVDFMSLLKNSLATNKRTPEKKLVAEVVAKTPALKSVRKSAASAQKTRKQA